MNNALAWYFGKGFAGGSGKSHRAAKDTQASIEDSVALADTILNPPEPNAKAIAAARRYKQKMRS